MIDTKTPTTFAFQAIPGGEPMNIRTLLINGNPWFVLSDVGRAINLDVGNIPASRFDPDEVRLLRRGDTASEAVTPPGFWRTTDFRLRVIAESALYSLIQRSDKPEARVFQDWVNGTVLPSIRKTGGYLLNEAARETAFADKREAMPLPMDIAEALSKFSAAQEETNRLLQAA